MSDSDSDLDSAPDFARLDKAFVASAEPRAVPWSGIAAEVNNAWRYELMTTNNWYEALYELGFVLGGTLEPKGIEHTLPKVFQSLELRDKDGNNREVLLGEDAPKIPAHVAIHFDDYARMRKEAAAYQVYQGITIKGGARLQKDLAKEELESPSKEDAAAKSSSGQRDPSPSKAQEGNDQAAAKAKADDDESDSGEESETEGDEFAIPADIKGKHSVYKMEIEKMISDAPDSWKQFIFSIMKTGDLQKIKLACVGMACTVVLLMFKDPASVCSVWDKQVKGTTKLTSTDAEWPKLDLEIAKAIANKLPTGGQAKVNMFHFPLATSIIGRNCPEAYDKVKLYASQYDEVIYNVMVLRMRGHGILLFEIPSGFTKSVGVELSQVCKWIYCGLTATSINALIKMADIADSDGEGMWLYQRCYSSHYSEQFAAGKHSTFLTILKEAQGIYAPQSKINALRISGAEGVNTQITQTIAKYLVFKIIDKSAEFKHTGSVVKESLKHLKENRDFEDPDQTSLMRPPPSTRSDNYTGRGTSLGNRTDLPDVDRMARFGETRDHPGDRDDR